MKKSSSLNPLGDLVRVVLEKNPAFAANPLGDWRDVVGEQVAKHSRPTRLKDKVLTITAEDSVWKHHIELNREALMDRINRGREEPLVEKVNVRVGHVPEETPDINPQHKMLNKIKSKRLRSGRAKRPLRELTREEKELLAGIRDKELKRISTRLLRRLPLEGEE
jgi:hypothetical protein